jgi:hypothetical protein
MTADLAGYKIPVALRPRAAELIAVTDRFCVERLDAEYADLCRRLIARLARKRPSPLERGEARSWAAGVIHALGTVNFLFDPSHEPYMRADQLAAGLGVSKATAANKAGRIRDLLGLAPLEPEFCRSELLEDHPYAWLVEVDGFLVDARWLVSDAAAGASLRR